MVSIPRYVRGLLESSAVIGHPDNRTLTAWIAFCRKIGWYFKAPFSLNGEDSRSIVSMQPRE